MSEPKFRESYPTESRPYATEFRPARHAKAGDRKYFLPGVERDGTIHLINFLCHSIQVRTDGSTVTDVPQTGRVILNGKSVIMDGKEKGNIVADEVIKIRPDGEVTSKITDEVTEVMILNLEFDKMQSDTLMFNDVHSEQRFVKDPSRRSMQAVGDFAGTDPAAITQQLFSELANHWPKVKPNKSR